MVLSYTKPPSHRQLRVAEQIRQILANLLITGELYHPLLEGHMITVHEVRISADLRMSTAFLEIPSLQLKGKEVKKLFLELGTLARRAVASRLSLRHVPEVRFVMDDATKRVENLEVLLRQANHTSGEKS